MSTLTDRVYPPFVTGRGTVGLLLLRLVAGLAFMFHGWGKIQNPFGWMGPDSGIPGMLQALAALSEFGGGLAWILGLPTPLASFGILCTMTVALGYHVSSGGSFVGGEGSYEPALVYLVVALLLILIGPGAFSLDVQVFGKRERP